MWYTVTLYDEDDNTISSDEIQGLTAAKAEAKAMLADKEYTDAYKVEIENPNGEIVFDKFAP